MRQEVKRDHQRDNYQHVHGDDQEAERTPLDRIVCLWNIYKRILALSLNIEVVGETAVGFASKVHDGEARLREG
jgi:hypothetical protein